MDFLLLANLAGLAAVLYGVLQTMALLRKSPGNARIRKSRLPFRKARKPT